MNDLFRQEVFEHRTQRLEGSVIIRQSFPLQVGVAVASIAAILAGCWMVFGSYARIVDAPGILTTTSPSALVQAPATGLVRSLKVAEGTNVSKGDLLATIDVDREFAKGEGYAGASLKTLQSRLAINRQRSDLAQAQLEAEKSRLVSTQQTALAQADNLKQQIAIQTDIVESNQRMLDQVRPVMERGFVSKVEFERRRQTLLASQQTLGTLQQNLIERTSEAQQARAALAKARAETLGQVALIESDSDALKQASAEMKSRARYVLTAPISGQVTALQTAPGRVADPSVPLMVILPAKSRLIAQIFAPTSAIGFVRQGQEVRILYDAFPYRQFGSFPGRVISVSKDVIDPRRSDLPIELKEPVYKILVELDGANRGGPDAIELKAGMTLRANMILERRSFLQWLLSPLNSFGRAST